MPKLTATTKKWLIRVALSVVAVVVLFKIVKDGIEPGGYQTLRHVLCGICLVTGIPSMLLMLKAQERQKRIAGYIGFYASYFVWMLIGHLREHQIEMAIVRGLVDLVGTLLVFYLTMLIGGGVNPRKKTNSTNIPFDL